MLNSHVIASMLNGREYANEVTPELSKLAKDNDLVIVFGSGDDSLVFRGSMNGELSVWEDHSVCVDKYGNIWPYWNVKEYPNKIDAIWSGAEVEAGWLIKSNIPHSTFDIHEEGGLFCRGIVFSRRDLK